MPIRSDRRGNLIKRSQYKKKQYKYWMKCADEHLVGTTDDPRRKPSGKRARREGSAEQCPKSVDFVVRAVPEVA